MFISSKTTLIGSVIFVIAALTGCGDGVSTEPVKPDAAIPSDKHPVAWSPRTGITLLADDFYIVAGGVKYVGADNVNVISDPGDPAGPAYTTLEATWMEHGAEMRLNIYFKSNGTSWLSEEIRTYNGKTTGADWIYYKGAYFATPVNQTFTGNLDLTADALNTVPGSIHFENLRLGVKFIQP